MAKQVQMRRDTDTDVMAGTPAVGEVWANTTKKRLHLGDGSTQGGHALLNAADIRNQAAIAADDTGSADTVAIAPEFAPAAYAAYQVFCFRPADNNTGAATLTVGALSAVAIKKLSGGALVDLDADDLVAGVPATVVHNGTYFVLQGSAAATSDSGPVWLGTFTAAAAGTLDITGIFDADYDDYRIELSGIISSSGTTADDFLMRVRRSGQGSFDASGSQYLTGRLGGTSPTLTNAIQLYKGAFSNASSQGLCGSLTIYDVSSTAKNKHVRALIGGQTSSGVYDPQDHFGVRETVSAVDAVQLRFLSGNITGVAKVFGVVKS